MSALQGEIDSFTINGPAGQLEAIQTLPKWSTIAVICHPNPTQGGTMNNKVVVTIARALRDLGIPSIRFNFRGIGSSEGKHDHIQGSLADTKAVINWAIQSNESNIILAGFSYGSYIALQAAQTCPQLAGLICVAPPVDRLDFQSTLDLTVPWLTILGSEDEIVPADQMIYWAKQVKPSPQLVIFPKVGHFFHGQLPQLHQAVTHYIQSCKGD